MKKTVSILSLTSSLRKALDRIPGSELWNPAMIGNAIDSTIKAVLKDVLDEHDLTAGIDYVDNLSATEQATDFVILTAEADELITAILEGKVVAVGGYTRTDSKGNVYEVKAHIRRKSS